MPIQQNRFACFGGIFRSFRLSGQMTFPESDCEFPASGGGREYFGLFPVGFIPQATRAGENIS